MQTIPQQVQPVQMPASSSMGLMVFSNPEGRPGEFTSRFLMSEIWKARRFVYLSAATGQNDFLFERNSQYLMALSRRSAKWTTPIDIRVILSQDLAEDLSGKEEVASDLFGVRISRQKPLDYLVVDGRAVVALEREKGWGYSEADKQTRFDATDLFVRQYGVSQPTRFKGRFKGQEDRVSNEFLLDLRLDLEEGARYTRPTYG